MANFESFSGEGLEDGARVGANRKGHSRFPSGMTDKKSKGRSRSFALLRMTKLLFPQDDNDSGLAGGGGPVEGEGGEELLEGFDGGFLFVGQGGGLLAVGFDGVFGAVDLQVSKTSLRAWPARMRRGIAEEGRGFDADRCSNRFCSCATGSIHRSGSSSAARRPTGNALARRPRPCRG